MSSTELSTSTNHEPEINAGTKEIKFINALKNLTDTRDNRGKRHSQVICVLLLFLLHWLIAQKYQASTVI